MDPSRDVVFYLPSVTPLLTDEPGVTAGGAETQVVLLAKALVRRGLRVALVAYPAPCGVLPGCVDGVDVLARRPSRANVRLFGKLLETHEMWRVLRRADARVVVVRVAGVQVGLAGLVAKLQRRRFVYSSASSADFDRGILGARVHDQALFRLGLRLADNVVVQSSEQSSAYTAALGRSALVIRSLAVSADGPREAGQFFLWAGWATWYKRPLAFLRLAEALPDARFVMVPVPVPGEAASWNELREQASRVGNVEVLSPMPHGELLRLIGQAVAVVNTSDFEGLSNVCLEGWSRGVPALVLTHDPDSIVERNNLGAYAAGSPARLAGAARELWRSRGAAEELAARCRAYVNSEHEEEAVASAWMGVVGPEALSALSPLGDVA